MSKRNQRMRTKSGNDYPTHYNCRCRELSQKEVDRLEKVEEYFRSLRATPSAAINTSPSERIQVQASGSAKQICRLATVLYEAFGAFDLTATVTSTDGRQCHASLTNPIVLFLTEGNRVPSRRKG